jgi:integrase/recombinase XerC
MPSLRKIPFTKPIPFGAQIFTRKGKRFARWIDGKSRPREAELTEDGTRIRQLSRKWYGCYTDADGVDRCAPLSTDKTAAQQMLAALVRASELGKAGIVDPYEQHRKRPLAEHVADFEASLLAKGGTVKQARQVAARVRRVLSGCFFVFAGDISASRTLEYLASLRQDNAVILDEERKSWTKGELAAVLGLKPHNLPPLVRRHGLAATGQGKARRYPRETAIALASRLGQGASVQTTNFYLQAVKQFCRWMVKDRRMADNPLAHLSGGNVRTDRRHDRRELTEEELRSLLSATRASERSFRGLSGPDRFHLYATACGTGFRASGLASLTPESFDLYADIPTVTLSAQGNKSRKLKVQPLPPDVAELLRVYLDGKPASVPLWGGTWASDNKGAEMLRGDLQAAGIPYVAEGPDGPLYADFHALRHTYLTLGGRAGIDLRTLQELAGHHSPTLTARYTHRRIYDLAGAVERLPDFLPPGDDPACAAGALAATGTDGGTRTYDEVSLRHACAPTEEKGLRVRTNEETILSSTTPEGLPQEPDSQGFEDECGDMRRFEGSTPGRARTCNLRFRRPMLYPVELQVHEEQTR